MANITEKQARLILITNLLQILVVACYTKNM